MLRSFVNVMTLRVLLLLLAALCAWDFATPVTSIGATVAWDDEEDAVRATPMRPRGPRPIAHRASPVRPDIGQRLVAHAAHRRQPDHRPPFARARARLARAVLDAPSEDH
jgi:hypothetical protein